MTCLATSLDGHEAVAPCDPAVALQVVECRLAPKRLPLVADEELAALLRGIGPCDVRAVLLVDDLGIRKGMQRHFKLPEAELSAPWRPYRTIASWHMWRLLESRSLARAARAAT